jgi:hypothetical protein
MKEQVAAVHQTAKWRLHLAGEEISLLAPESARSNAGAGVSLWFRERCAKGISVEKIPGDGLTGRGFALFCEPRWTAGPECVRGRSCTFGTANWTQFCPGMIIGNEIMIGREIEFFCDLKWT